jgi:hypothetical protein
MITKLTAMSQHKTKIGFNTELIHKTLLQYSIECVLNTCNSHDIIFYNDNDRNLISTIAFLSNLGFVLLNANKNEGVPNNIIANPYKLASVYLKNIGMPDTICYLVEHILEIKIYNSRNAIIAGMSDYYNNQLECVKTVIDSNDLGYNADNFKDIEKIENFELLMAIDKCMSEHVATCRENEIDLYLYGFKYNFCIFKKSSAVKIFVLVWLLLIIVFDIGIVKHSHEIVQNQDKKKLFNVLPLP